LPQEELSFAIQLFSCNQTSQEWVVGYLYFHSFLGKLRIATISFGMSLFPHAKDFHEIWC